MQVGQPQGKGSDFGARECCASGCHAGKSHGGKSQVQEKGKRKDRELEKEAETLV